MEPELLSTGRLGTTPFTGDDLLRSERQELSICCLVCSCIMRAYELRMTEGSKSSKLWSEVAETGEIDAVEEGIVIV